MQQICYGASLRRTRVRHRNKQRVCHARHMLRSGYISATALKSPEGLPANTICSAWASRFVTFVSTSCVHKAYTLKSPEGFNVNSPG